MNLGTKLLCTNTPSPRADELILLKLHDHHRLALPCSDLDSDTLSVLLYGHRVNIISIRFDSSSSRK